MPKEIKIQADPQRVALDKIKDRQKARKETGTPKSVSLADVYQALSDTLENQARIENRQLEILKLLKGGR